MNINCQQMVDIVNSFTIKKDKRESQKETHENEI
jgi:hypothetical protein